ncbi:MAG: thermonuclease family protein [Pseudomonadota bacterium]
MKRFQVVSPLLSLVVFAGLAVIVAQGEKQARSAMIEGTVNYISDGDTFRINGHAHPIRLWGIDAPEIDRAAGTRAKAQLHGLVTGVKLTCHRKATDKYRRTVAQCFVGVEDISWQMIASGHAIEMCGFSRNAYGTCVAAKGSSG